MPSEFSSDNETARHIFAQAGLNPDGTEQKKHSFQINSKQTVQKQSFRTSEKNNLHSTFVVRP